MKKIQIYFILCLLIFGVYLLKHRTNNAQDLLKQNTSELILSIKKIPNSNTIINIQDLTKFKWTKVYAFTSSIERSSCEKILGVKIDDYIKWKYSEKNSFVIFMNDQVPVCFFENNEDISLNFFPTVYPDIYENLSIIGFNYDDILPFVKKNNNVFKILNNKELIDYNYTHSQSISVHGMGYWFITKKDIESKKINFPYGSYLSAHSNTFSDNIIQLNANNKLSDRIETIKYAERNIDVINADNLELVANCENKSQMIIKAYSYDSSINILINDINTVINNAFYDQKNNMYIFSYSPIIDKKTKIIFKNTYIEDIWIY